jgi:uncharacterized protein (DUF58 family)
MSSLSPAVVAAVQDLGLAARLVVEGIRAGGHRSPFHGYSAEFQQHRAYRAGDDLKYVDWKLLARTDRLYSRQFRETTSMSVMLVLDGSASMAFPEEGLTKFRYASIVAAALAYLVTTQGDAVGMMAMARGARSYLPARGGRPHLRSLIAQLDRLRPGGSWQPARAIDRAADLLKRRGMILVLSDFYDDEEAVRRTLRRVAHSGHDVGMLQIIAEEERALPYRGDVELEDLESGERRLVRASAIADEYARALNDFLTRVREGAHRDGIDYALMPTSEPPEHALRAFLLPREARA